MSLSTSTCGRRVSTTAAAGQITNHTRHNRDTIPLMRMKTTSIWKSRSQITTIIPAHPSDYQVFRQRQWRRTPRLLTLQHFNQRSFKKKLDLEKSLPFSRKKTTRQITKLPKKEKFQFRKKSKTPRKSEKPLRR